MNSLEAALMLLVDLRGYEQPRHLSAPFHALVEQVSREEPELMNRVRSRTHDALTARGPAPAYAVTVTATGQDVGVHHPWDGHEDTARHIAVQKLTDGTHSTQLRCGPGDLTATRIP